MLSRMSFFVCPQSPILSTVVSFVFLLSKNDKFCDFIRFSLKTNLLCPRCTQCLCDQCADRCRSDVCRRCFCSVVPSLAAICAAVSAASVTSAVASASHDQLKTA